MNKGPQKKTVEKYISYLKELVHKHELTRFTSVNLKDYELLKKYFPNNNSDLSRPYSYMIKYFKSIGFITGNDSYYIPKEKAYLYDLNINMVKSFGILYEIPYSIPYLIPYDMSHNMSHNISFKADKVESKVRFGRLFLDKKFDDKTIAKILANNYDQLVDYQRIIFELNTTECTYANLISMQPTIRRGPKGNVSSIGIRASQLCCSLLNADKHPDANYKQTRQYFFDEEFGEWEEYDVKGSIPRVARFCNMTEWLDADIDPYYEMFHDFDFKSTFEDGEEGWTKHNRDIAKLVFMLVFFGGTPSEIIRSVTRNGDYIGKKQEIKFIDKSKIDELKARVKKFCGSDDRKETGIFLHESCIYLDVMYELMKRNIPVYQVYDGFFFKKETMPADMDEIIKTAAINYYNRYSVW